MKRLSVRKSKLLKKVYAPVFNSVEICAGAGGQALGLEQAGFKHEVLVENDSHPCQTLRLNRPKWNVIEGDLRNFSGKSFRGVTLLAGGVPCPPFSVAGQQLGEKDDRDLFPEALRLIKEINPKAVMLENVAGFAKTVFEDYRTRILKRLSDLGYLPDWKILNACDFGVPQLRPRCIIVALKREYADYFIWPDGSKQSNTVSTSIFDLMAVDGWKGAKDWKIRANAIAPTLVGGSKKHGGPDLGPSRAKTKWRELGVNGNGLADAPPDRKFPKTGFPKLTVRMAARIQGFPDEWEFSGKKTASYRQVGNALPPPVARAVGVAIRNALLKRKADSFRENGQSFLFLPTQMSVQ
jgi:DNA (cytosine-5)-methyltransferase 1